MSEGPFQLTRSGDVQRSMDRLPKRVDALKSPSCALTLRSVPVSQNWEPSWEGTTNVSRTPLVLMSLRRMSCLPLRDRARQEWASLPLDRRM